MEDIRFEHFCLYDSITGYAYQVIKQPDEPIIRIHPKALLDLFNHLSRTGTASPAACGQSVPARRPSDRARHV